MRTVALGSLLFCGLAAVLGYVATSGVGMRTTGFSPTAVDNISTLPQKIVAPPPEIEIDAKPLKPVAAPVPAVTTSPAKPKSATAKLIVKKAVVPKAKAPLAKSEDKQELSKQPVVMKPVAPTPKLSESKATSETRTARTQSLAFTVQPESTNRDESQSMQRDQDAERQWREQTLSRWRAEQAQAAQNRDGHPDPTLDETPAGGLYKADTDKKPKKKRHRFLFIRW